MKENYLCPHCRGYLNVEGSIVFTVKNNLGESAIFLLHPELGNYEVSKHHLFFMRMVNTLISGAPCAIKNSLPIFMIILQK